MAIRKKSNTKKVVRTSSQATRQQWVASFIYVCSVVVLFTLIFMSGSDLTQRLVDNLTFMSIVVLALGFVLSVYLNVLQKGVYWPIFWRKRSLSEQKAKSRSEVLVISYGKFLIVSLFITVFWIMGTASYIESSLASVTIILYGLSLPAITASFRKE